MRSKFVRWADNYDRALLDDPLMTPKEVAVMFNVHSKTVTSWSRRGLLPCIRTLGGHRRFRLSDVEAAIKEAGSG